MPQNESDGKYKGFRLEARPKEYGEQAFRSYFMDEGGIIHATPQNRAATSADPDASCELQQKDCSLAAVPLAAAESPK